MHHLRNAVRVCSRLVWISFASLSFGQTVIVTPISLSFTVQAGDPTAFPQQIDVNSSGPPISFIVSAIDHLGRPWSKGGWLSVIGTTAVSIDTWQATTPASVSVFVNPSGLSAGTYTGSVSITLKRV
jgi:hypothetical protein